MSISRKWVLVVLVLLATGLGLSMVVAQDEVGELQYRQKLMKGHAASMGSIGDMLKYKLSYDPSHIEMHAKNLNSYASLIKDAFKANKDGQHDAQAAVWSDWSDFESKADALVSASGALAKAAASGDMKAIMPQVKATGDACRGCHNTYRKPEEERFPR